MHGKLILSSVLIITTLYTAAQDNNPLIDSREIIDAGVKLYDEGKYKEALREYQKVKAGDTNYVRALYEMALVCSADSQYAQGIRYCEEALAYPTEKERTPELLTQYASLLDYDNQQERSLKVFDSALAIYPAELFLYINKGTTLLRMEKYREAEKVFQQALLLNPYSASAHMKLGLCAVKQGKIIPAFLCMVANLVMQPEGNFSRNAIYHLSQISKSTDDVMDMVNKRTQEPSDNFRMVEQIVLSKIALDKNYKSIIRLDDPISRQMQVMLEKLSYDAADTGFYMQFYVPWLRQVFDNKQFEQLVNHAFSGVDIAAIREYNKKHKKEIESFITETVNYFNIIRFTRELQAGKRDPNGALYVFNNGKLYGKGASRNKGNLLYGPWEYYYSSGNIMARGKYNDQGEKEGPWTYYHFNGQVRGKENFVNGKEDGPEIYYYDNGQLSSRATYKNGEPEGEHTSWYRNGKKRFTQYFKNGKVNGEKTNWYQTGVVQSTGHYKDNVLDGPFKTWYENGRLNGEGTYTNDKISGTYKEWYKDGILSLEGQYLDGEAHGTVKRYHRNGKLNTLETYNKGALEGEYESYFDNGQLYTKYVNNKKGKVNGDVQYFDKDGKLNGIFTFEDDKIKVARYFDKTGKEISTSKADKGQIDLLIYRTNGTKKMLTPYSKKGFIDGKQVYYYGSGKDKEWNTYKEGVLNGEAATFYPNGKKKAKIDYEDGEKNGYFTSWYLDGGLEEEGWYKDGTLQGEWLSYNEYNTLMARASYLNGELNGIRTMYWPNGKKETETLYNLGTLEEMKEYDTTGKVINHVKLKDGNGKYLSFLANGKPYSQGTYIHGNLEGEFKFLYFDGSVRGIQYFKCGLLDSVYKSWFHKGKLSLEGMYDMDEKTGVWKYYHPDGSLWYTETYVAGQLHGNRVFYHKNGKIESEMEYKYGEKNGVNKRYDETGSLVVMFRYEDGLPMAYTYEDKNGKLVPEIPLVQGNGTIKAFFANGRPSLICEYVEGEQHGPYTLYHSTGKPALENTEHYGNSEGPLTSYYADGTKRSIFNYRYGNVHGPYSEFNAKGVLVEAGNYYNDQLHGERRYYDDNGKLKKTEIYYYGQLLGVQ